ncbi:MAG: hypothetical protein WCC21_04800 [Candidatus Acidiferrales bacterium]
MRKQFAALVVLLFTTSPLVALAQTPKDSVIVSDEDVKAVLKRAVDTHRTIPDNMIRVIDMGEYQLGIAIVHRGAMGGTRKPTSNGGGGAVNPSQMCGEQRPDAKGPHGILHDATDESYIVTSGSATLITGGTIINGRRSGPTSEITTTLNGPSCSGTMVGYTSRIIKEGDVVIIPEGVPHGFSAIPDHITYLSLRPDLRKVLPHEYVNPALKQ